MDKIRIINLFSGYGSASFALNYLGAKYTNWTSSEWAIPSIRAYKDAHFSDDTTDYSASLTNEDLVDYFTNHQISSDYSRPLTREELFRRKDLRQIYNDGMASKNKFSILAMSGTDLEIVETDKYHYILTWTFPCQSLSTAGNQSGMKEGSGTKSSIGWEAIRLIRESPNKPQTLIMENVTQILNHRNKPELERMIDILSTMGYSSNIYVMNGNDYGIPHGRERCFMVSTLGDVRLAPLLRAKQIVLGDVLDDLVPNKYYRSSDMIRKMQAWTATHNPLEHIQRKGCFSPTICAKAMTKENSLLPLYSATPGYEINIRELDADEIYDAYHPRKYTEKECFRLMGVVDSDFERMAHRQSMSSLYYMAGNGIITTCLMALLGTLLGIDYQDKITDLQEQLTSCKI